MEGTNGVLGSRKEKNSVMEDSNSLNTDCSVKVSIEVEDSKECSAMTIIALRSWKLLPDAGCKPTPKESGNFLRLVNLAQRKNSELSPSSKVISN